MQKAADDFAAIARRLAEIEADRVYDYAVMSETETILLQPKSPFIGAQTVFEPHGKTFYDPLTDSILFETDRKTFYDSFFRRLGR